MLARRLLVPLALLDAPWAKNGKIILLEPRRLAARAAARAHVASCSARSRGATIGYAMRMESRMSAKTRVMVVTEGVLARMILDDPELPGVSVVLFDEFHERSLDGDFGLALALDVQNALRPDLAAARHVGDAGRCARGKAARRGSGDRERRPQLPGRYPLR